MPWTIELSSADVLDSLWSELDGPQHRLIVNSELARLEAYGLNLLSTNRMKSLSNGLFELRVRRNPEVLVRIFFTFIHPSRLVVVGGYNKKRDSSELKQRREIRAARKIIDDIQGRS